jgi:hypothetical protein
LTRGQKVVPLIVVTSAALDGNMELLSLPGHPQL